MIFGFGRRPVAAHTPPLETLLTIVIPSRGRQEQLSKLVGYYASMGVKCRVLLLLSGQYPPFLSEQFPALSYEILEYPDSIPFAEKIIDGMKHVHTPFTALCTDDDIVLPSGLAACTTFLHSHPDYSACQGYHALFSEEQGVANLVRILWFTPSLESDDPFDRLYRLVLRYQPICWAVFTTPTVRAIAQQMLLADLNSFFTEMIWSGTAAICGKVKRVPGVYCLRRIDRAHLMGNPVFAMMEDPQAFFAGYKHYSDLMLAQLGSKRDWTGDALRRAFDMMHLAYFSRETSPSVWNFMIDQVMANPRASIHDANIDAALRSAPPDISQGWQKEVLRDGQKFRLFPAMLSPEPREEIALASDYEASLISEVAAYFRAPGSLRSGS